MGGLSQRPSQLKDAFVWNKLYDVFVNPLMELCSSCTEKSVKQPFAAGRTASACPCNPQRRAHVRFFKISIELGGVSLILGNAQRLSTRAARLAPSLHSAASKSTMHLRLPMSFGQEARSAQLHFALAPRASPW